MSGRRVAIGVVVVLGAAVAGGCADDPEEVVARGADEVVRHSATRWARLSIDGLSEAEYHVAPAFVAEATGNKSHCNH